MEEKYITDTDFLPQELTHYLREYSDEMTDGLYQIVFRIFLSPNNLNQIYDQVIRIAHRDISATVRNFKLRSWKERLDGIRKVLTKFKSKENDVIVYIPYADCKMPLDAVESSIKLVIFTIDELLNSNSLPEPLFPEEKSVPDIKGLFVLFYEDIYESLDEGKPGASGLLERTRYNHLIIQDEMYRRGIRSIKYKDKEFNIQPSQLFGDTQLYKLLFIDNGRQRQQETDGATNIPNDALASIYDNDTIGTRAKVMYAMMRSICKPTKDNFNIYVALIDFAVGKQPRRYHINTTNDTGINLENNKNTIKKYVRYCNDNPDYLTEPASDKVRARLMEQGFDIQELCKGSTNHT